MPSQTFLVKSTASLLLKIPKLIKSLFHLLIKDNHPLYYTIQERIRLMQQLLKIRGSIVLPMTGKKERDVSAPAQEKPESITVSDADGKEAQVPIPKDKKK